MGALNHLGNIINLAMGLPEGLRPNVVRWRRTRKFITIDFSKRAWKRFDPLGAAQSAFETVGPMKITVPLEIGEWALGRIFGGNP